MHCQMVQKQLYSNHSKQSQDYYDELFDHLVECAHCWTLAESLWEKEAKSNAFKYDGAGLDTEAVLAKAWQDHLDKKTTPYRPRFGQLASVAMVLIVCGVVFLQNWTGKQSTVPASEIAVSPGGVNQLDFLLTSAIELQQATITLQLGENLILSGYPGLRRISWLTHIREGNNQLTLPLLVEDEKDGVIIVNVESDGLQKQTMFTVKSA